MACLWPASYGGNAGFRVFVASLLCGFGRVVEITIGGRAKSYNPGGYPGGYVGGYPGGYPGGVYCRNGIKPHKRQGKTSLVWGMRGPK